MSTALKLLAAIVLASIFMGIFVAIQGNWGRSNEIITFKNKSSKLAKTIGFLKDVDVGSKQFFQITVPEECGLRFENKKVIAVISGVSHTYSTKIELEGENLQPDSYDLKLLRTENGVSVNVR